MLIAPLAACARPGPSSAVMSCPLEASNTSSGWEHVVVIEAVEERELLVAVRRVIGRIDVEHDEFGRRVKLVHVASFVLAPEPIPHGL
jgi:hypothetical protein